MPEFSFMLTGLQEHGGFVFTKLAAGPAQLSLMGSFLQN
jgi:hypothetical protein